MSGLERRSIRREALRKGENSISCFSRRKTLFMLPSPHQLFVMIQNLLFSFNECGKLNVWFRSQVAVTIFLVSRMIQISGGCYCFVVKRSRILLRRTPKMMMMMLSRSPGLRSLGGWTPMQDDVAFSAVLRETSTTFWMSITRCAKVSASTNYCSCN